MQTSIEKQTAKIILILVLIIRTLFTFNRAFNADEFQHLHNAWMIHLGFLPYRDFWDNHTPLLQGLLAPLLGVFGEGTASALTVRVLISICSLGILFPVYKIARLLIDAQTALVAIVLLSVSEIFMQKTIEVRPDCMLAMFFLLSLWACIHQPHRFFLSGVLLGIAALFSPKALICLAAAALFLPMANASWSFRIHSKRAAALVSGFVLPAAALAAFFYRHGAVGSLIQCVLLENFSYPDSRGPWFLLQPQNLAFVLLSFAGMYLWFRKQEARNPLSVLFLTATFLLVLFAFVMPAPFSQSALMFLPIFAIGAAYATRRSLESHRPIFRILALTAGLVLPLISIAHANPFRQSNESQLQLMNYVLRNSSRNAPIFDGDSAYIFRRQAFYYGSLVEGVRQRIRAGAIRQDIPGALIKEQCPLFIYDDRVSDLPTTIQNFLRSNYTATGFANVYVAGKDLDSAEISGDHATFTIDLPMMYRVETHTKSFRVDQRIYKGQLFLGKGIHRIHAAGKLGYVKIRAAL